MSANDTAHITLDIELCFQCYDEHYNGKSIEPVALNLEQQREMLEHLGPSAINWSLKNGDWNDEYAHLVNYTVESSKYNANKHCVTLTIGFPAHLDVDEVEEDMRTFIWLSYGDTECANIWLTNESWVGYNIDASCGWKENKAASVKGSASEVVVCSHGTKFTFKCNKVNGPVTYICGCVEEWSNSIWIRDLVPCGCRYEWDACEVCG